MVVDAARKGDAGAPLEGMVVVAQGGPRALALAASWLAELGAVVHLSGDVVPGSAAPDLDRAWIAAGGPSVGGSRLIDAPPAGTTIDLVLVPGGITAREVHNGPARCTVTLHGTPPDGPLGGTGS